MSDAPWQRFTDDQRRAALLVDRSVVSVAAAGAGKTQVMAVRYCACLLRDRELLGPERVLAITFTREAAANLRARIDRVLRAVVSAPVPSFPHALRGEAEAELAPAEIEHLTRCLERLPNAPIGTVDSFCSSLVREHAALLGRDPDLHPPGSDGPEVLACRDEAWRRLRAEMAAEEGGDLLDLVEAHGERPMRALIAQLAERSATLPVADSFASDEDALAELLRRRADSLAAIPQALADAVAETSAKNVGGQAVRAAQDAYARAPADIVSWVALVAGVKAYGSEAAKDAIRRLRDLAREPAHGACLALLATTNPADEALWQARAQRLARCIARFRSALDASMSERGLSGFATIAHDALRLLDHAPMRARLTARYRHVLLDESQDLNRLQGALVDRLRVGPRGEQPRVFAVGDHRQSIYGFRHADPDQFRGWERDAEAAGGATAPLGVNFRSHPRLIAAVGRLFSSPTLIDEFRADTVVAGKSTQDSPEGGRLVCTAVDGGDDATALPDHIARVVTGLLIAGRRPEHIAIILRTRRRMRRFADSLERIGVPVDTDFPGGLYDAQECHDVEAILRLCLDPNDRFALACAVSGPWGVADPQDRRLLVEALSDRAQSASASAPASAWTRIRAATPVGAVVDTIAPILANEGVAAAIRTLARDPRATARYGSLPLARRRLANLIALADEEEGAGGALDGAALVERWAERRRLGADGAEARGESLGSRGVRLLTIHGSKGLEWPVVILPDLQQRFDRRDLSRPALARATPQGLALTCGPGSLEEGVALRRALAAEDVAAASAREEARLFYVACTRAMDELHLVAASGRDPAVQSSSTSTSASASCPADWVDLARLPWEVVPAQPPPPRELASAAVRSEDALPRIAVAPAITGSIAQPLTRLVEQAVEPVERPVLN
nr:UvrD-helicase domain-containing protein [Planctomycetota bacterium]